jgi:hypothetical protein
MLTKPTPYEGLVFLCKRLTFLCNTHSANHRTGDRQLDFKRRIPPKTLAIPSGP